MGNTYRHRYKAFRRPADFQMHIDAPVSVVADSAESVRVVANVFNAWPDAEVKMRIGREGVWVNMERVLQEDPIFLAYRERNDRVAERFWRNPLRPRTSRHLWSASISEKLSAGAHVIEIQARNPKPDSQVFRGVRVLRADP